MIFICRWWGCRMCLSGSCLSCLCLMSRCLSCAWAHGCVFVCIGHVLPLSCLLVSSYPTPCQVLVYLIVPTWSSCALLLYMVLIFPLVIAGSLCVCWMCLRLASIISLVRAFYSAFCIQSSFVCFPLLLYFSFYLFLCLVYSPVPVLV